jgi:hypothetical protein
VIGTRLWAGLSGRACAQTNVLIVYAISELPSTRPARTTVATKARANRR